MEPGRELSKEWRAIATELVRNQGWRYEYKGKHAKLYPADKQYIAIVFSATPSDGRAIKNFIALVRRSGARLRERAMNTYSVYIERRGSDAAALTDAPWTLSMPS